MVAVAESEYIVTSLSAVAEFFGVSVTAVSRDWRPAGMPGEHSRYDLREIARWKRERDAKRVDQASGRAEQAHLKERLELADVITAEATARKKTVEADIAEGEVILLEDAIAVLEHASNVIRSRAESLPGELVSGLPPEYQPDMMANAQHKVDLMCRELADLVGKLDGGIED